VNGGQATPASPDRFEARTLRKQRPRLGDSAFRYTVLAAASVVLLAFSGTAVFLLNESWSALSHYGPLSFFSSSRWAPSEVVATASHPNPYGILQFIYGTLVTSAIAMILAVPIGVAVALFVNEIAPRRLKGPLSSAIDLFAAVPSVVYGFWGIFALIPAIRPYASDVGTWSTGKPIVGTILAGPFFGPSYITAGFVLAIMVLPIVTAICREVFDVTPQTEKEAALALGATRWEMLKMSVLRRSRVGIFGASILGLGRAFGETIAVTMVIGNSVLEITKSLFGQGATMPSVIANEFTEATEPFHLSSLFVVATALLAFTLIVNIGGKLVIARISGTIA
jgi:phosphate transport system permease protein